LVAGRMPSRHAGKTAIEYDRMLMYGLLLESEADYAPMATGKP
jgi:hypothetical protein